MPSDAANDGFGQNRLHELVAIGLYLAKFGNRLLGRTKAALIYRRTGNLPAVSSLGHSKIESAVTSESSSTMRSNWRRRLPSGWLQCPHEQTWSAIAKGPPTTDTLRTANGTKRSSFQHCFDLLEVGFCMRVRMHQLQPVGPRLDTRLSDLAGLSAAHRLIR